MNMDTIPASTDGQQSQHHPAAVAPANAFHGGPINILIVDDEPKNLTVLETVLDNPGYRLVRAGSADQALLALVEEEFALLILDIRMPGMTGFELAQLIKERKKTSRVPIIFLTAYYNEDQHVLEGYGTGAVDYLHKPVNPAILRSKVAVFAELHSKSRALRAEVTEHRRTAEQLRELNETLELRVTERTEALRLSEERYRMLFETAPMALFVCDRNAVIQHYNRRAVELWGREPICGVEQHCGSVKLWLPDHTLLPHALSPMVEVLRTGIPATNIEVSIERPDGSCVPVLVNFAALKGAQGEITGAITSFIDIAERKRVEEALSRSERNLSDFFDNASVGLHWVGPDGIILKVNQTELDLLGYNREEYVGHHIAEFHVDQPVIQGILDRLAGGEVLREYPARIRCKDGSILDVLINSNVLFEEGKFIHTRCFTRDITDRKRAEEALRENEERFRTLADNVSQFAWTADPTGLIFWYNRRWYEYTGTTFEEMQGWGWEKVHHPDHLDRVVKKWRQALAIGEPWEDTFPLRGLDGTYRWFLSRALPIRDAEGRIVRWFGTNTDVTEQREAEAALGESEQRYRTTFANAAVGIAHVGIDGRWLRVNDAVCRITGYGREELLMKPFAEITHPDDLDPEWANARRLLAGESATYSMDKRYIRKEGGLTWIHLTVSLQRDEAGSPQDFICIIEDITTRKQAEDALLERDRALTAVNETLRIHTMALADANKELEGFSYSVSHDLRAPLRTIDAFSRILEEDHGAHLNAEANRCLTIVRKAAAQAGELIDDLLEFSRLGRQGMSVSSVEMADLAREAADELMTMHDGRQIDLTIGDLPSCQGDRRFLKLVWTNLLMNAIKYTKYRNEAKIEVGWMPNDASAEAVTYYIKDNGVGFDMKYAHKLFGVFHRLHQKEDFEGTGVGLAIVRRIVQRHGGRIWGEGKVDSGATFSFSVRKATA